MKRNFNGNANKGGIYKIVNLTDGKIYIGSCKSFKKRAYQHCSRLKRRVHANNHLQNAWNKWGEESFLFEVVEVIEGNKESRTLREQELIDKQLEADNWQRCYNIKKKTVSSDRKYWSRTQDGFSEEHKKNLSKALKKHYRNNPEACQAISKRMKGVQQRLGQTHTEDTKRKMSESQKGRKHTEEAKTKMSESHLGKVISTTTRKKISEATKGKTVSKKTRQKISKALKGRLKDPEERKQVYGRKKTKEERKKISKARTGVRILKDRGYNEEVKHVLQCIIDDRDLPEELEAPQISYIQLREAYNKWNTGSKNLELRSKQKQEKKRLKQWLIEQNLWYDARSDSWSRKSEEDKKAAVKILKENQHKSSIFQRQFGQA